MEKLIINEKGMNFTKKVAWWLIFVPLTGVGLFLIIMSLYILFKSESPHNDVTGLLFMGIAILALPWLFVIFKQSSEIEVISSEEDLVIKKNGEELLNKKWSEIKSINATSAYSTPLGIGFVYMDSNGKKQTFGLSTKYLKQDDINSIALLIDNKWTNKFGKPKILNV